MRTVMENRQQKDLYAIRVRIINNNYFSIDAKMLIRSTDRVMWVQQTGTQQ